jgi:hypothetical protein
LLNDGEGSDRRPKRWSGSGYISETERLSQAEDGIGLVLVERFSSGQDACQRLGSSVGHQYLNPHLTLDHT